METASAVQDNWTFQQGGRGRRRGLCIMNPFLHICTVCSYATYVVTGMCSGGRNIRIFGIFEC